jgi:DNA polymerase I-like protein with 3'-5' exonuclease and polymerase domains
MEKVRAVIPKQIEEYDMRIRHVAEDPDMNPESNPQIAWLLYDKLQLGSPEEDSYDSGERGRKRPARSTERDILEKLAADSGSPVPIWVSRRRALAKILGTYIDGWVRSADMHDGELRTWWMLTGAITGRLRSGGDGKPGYVNLQNLINDNLLLNMLVSSKDFRRALEVKL